MPVISATPLQRVQMVAPLIVRQRPSPVRDAASTLLQLELERSGERVGFGQPQAQDLADRVTRPCFLAGKDMRLLIVAKALVAQRRDRHQTVTAKREDRKSVV